MRCLVKLVLLGVIAAAVVASVVGYLAWRSLVETPFGDYSQGEKVVVVEPGSSGRAILDRLEAEGVIAHADLTRLYLVYGLDSPALQAGEYRFDQPSTAHDALQKLIEGEVITYPVTIIEGLTLEETAAALADAEFGDLDRFLAEMRSPERILDLDPDAETLEGYLFPDTYHFARGTGEAEIVSAMVRNFRDQFEASASELEEGTTLREIVILASVVEKEAQLDEERTTIAAVYVNRLERGIALYADPTIIYALKRRGTWDGNIRKPDLDIDSPYNTYRRPGLPPGPICSPGLASLQAAAGPAEVPYLYFVSRNGRLARLRPHAGRAQSQRRALAAPLLAREVGRRAQEALRASGSPQGDPVH